MELSSLEPVLSVSHKANVDIQVDETVNATAPFEVDTIVITIEAINNGPSNATGVEVTHILPTELHLFHTAWMQVASTLPPEFGRLEIYLSMK